MTFEQTASHKLTYIYRIYVTTRLAFSYFLMHLCDIEKSTSSWEHSQNVACRYASSRLHNKKLTTETQQNVAQYMQFCSTVHCEMSAVTC